MANIERHEAAAEMLKTFMAATAERRRARVVAVPLDGAAPVDVTEALVSVLDALTETLDWGSGFFTDEDLQAFILLCELLKVDRPDSGSPTLTEPQA